jgi:hypothetical protein
MTDETHFWFQDKTRFFVHTCSCSVPSRSRLPVLQANLVQANAIFPHHSRSYQEKLFETSSQFVGFITDRKFSLAQRTPDR